MQSSRPLHLIPRTLYILLSLAFLITFVLTLWMAFYSPVNGDEIFWKLMISRLESDHGKLVYLFAQCQQGQWIDAPLTWYPAMWINSWLYEDASHPWELRVHGTALFMVLLGLWTWLLRHRSGLGWPDSFLAVSAFLSVGVMPFLMVYERPEQPLLLLLTLGLLTTIAVQPRPDVSWGRGVLVVLAFALLATLLSGTHPKGMFLFPVLLVLAWRQMRSLVWTALLAVILGWTAFDTQQVWQLRTTCPEFPGLMKTLQNLTLRPQMLFSDPVGFIQAGWANLMAFGAYVNSLGFQQAYVSSWLPAATEDWPASQTMVVLANTLLWMPLVIAVLITGSNWVSARRVRGWNDILLWLALLLAFGAIVVLQTAKNFYEASMIWPLVLLLAIFSFGQPLTDPRSPVVRTMLGLLLCVAVLSGLLRMERFGAFSEHWRQVRAEQTATADQQNAALRDFARQQCGIDTQAKRLVLDKDSYQAFWQHEQPLFLDYASGWWAAESDIRTTMDKRDVGGLVAKCEGVPEELRPYMIRQSDAKGAICCIAAEHLR